MVEFAVALLTGFSGQYPAYAAALSTARSLIEVPTQPFIEAYGESKAKEINFTDFSFSPDGRLLAITIADIATGDPEQVWLFDTQSRKLRLATEKIDKDYRKLGLNIREVTWESPSKVCILENRWGTTVPNGRNPVMVHATMSSSEMEIFSGPDETLKQAKVVVSPGKHYQFEFDSNGPGDARLVDISHFPTRNLLEKPHPWYRLAKWTPDDRYVIFYESHGHGSGSLLAAETVPSVSTFTIVADGGGYLLGFSVSPGSAKIAFSAKGIAIYDLDKRRVVKTIPTDLALGRTLAWSADNRIAYEADTCIQPLPGQIVGSRAGPRQTMERICIINIFDGQPQ